MLVKSGANIRRQNFVGDTPLLFAVKQRSYNTVEVLLRAGANTNTANLRGQFPLGIAMGACPVFNINCKTRIQENTVTAFPLQIKSPNNCSMLSDNCNTSWRIAILLLASGANPNQGNLLQDSLNFSDDRGVRLLLEHGVDINQVQTESNNEATLIDNCTSPFSLAKQKETLELLNLLSKNGADPNLNIDFCGPYGLWWTIMVKDS